MADLLNLTINIPNSQRFKIRFLSWMGTLMVRFPLIAKGLRWLGRNCLSLSNLENEERLKLQCLQRLKQDRMDAQHFGSGHGYSDEVHELNVAYKYLDQLQSKNFTNSKSESDMLYKHILNKISDLLSRSQGIDTFVNFGVSYGFIDSELAKKFPGIHFLGVDRSHLTKLFNEKHFLHIQNLHFVAEDIYRFLEKGSFKQAIFFHSRILCLMSMAFIKELYRRVRGAGFRYIVGMEQIGFSQETFKAYRFSEYPQNSVYFRSGMFIHNYPGLLIEEGFRPVEVELLNYAKVMETC